MPGRSRPGPAGPSVELELKYQLPSGSTKDRLAAHVLRRAVQAGRVHVATVACDRMERYFSTDLFDDLRG